MQKQTKLEEILRAFDETLRPLYLECEAGFAEDLQCEIARKAVFLLETERKEAVEGFARWWNVHGGKGEEFITRNSWREYKEHLTQTKGDKSMVKDETAIHSEEDVRLDKFWSNPHQQKERGNTGDTDVIFKTFKQHLIEVIEKNGWDWKASGGEKILEYLKHNKEGDKE